MVRPRPGGESFSRKSTVPHVAVARRMCSSPSKRVRIQRVFLALSLLLRDSGLQRAPACCTFSYCTPTKKKQVGFVSATSSSSGGSTSSVTSADLSGLSAARWTLEYETGGTGLGVRVALACVLVLWLLGWLAWCSAVFRNGKATAQPKVRWPPSSPPFSPLTSPALFPFPLFSCPT